MRDINDKCYVTTLLSYWAKQNFVDGFCIASGMPGVSLLAM